MTKKIFAFVIIATTLIVSFIIIVNFTMKDVFPDIDDVLTVAKVENKFAEKPKFTSEEEEVILNEKLYTKTDKFKKDDKEIIISMTDDYELLFYPDINRAILKYKKMSIFSKRKYQYYKIDEKISDIVNRK